MSPERYALTAFGLCVAGFAAVIAAFWEPELWAPGWAWRGPVSIVIGSALIAGKLYQFAGELPSEQQTSFWAYKKPNRILLLLSALVFICGLYVLLRI